VEVAKIGSARAGAGSGGCLTTLRALLPHNQFHPFPDPHTPLILATRNGSDDEQGAQRQPRGLFRSSLTILLPMFQQSFRVSVAAEADRIIYHTFPTKASGSGS
jgi:hypothetical protein